VFFFLVFFFWFLFFFWGFGGGCGGVGFRLLAPDFLHRFFPNSFVSCPLIRTSSLSREHEPISLLIPSSRFFCRFYFFFFP